ARTPEKLVDLLKKLRRLSQALLDAKLVIVKGNAKDPKVAKKVVMSEDGQMVDQIVFGIGGTPKFTPNPLKPTLDDPHVCEEAMASIKTAISDIKHSSQVHQMPLLTALSTTGVSKSRDTPMMMTPLYHWLGAVPHADKKKLEDQVELAKSEGLIRNYVIVRPSLLVDGQTQGTKEVKVGWEGKAPGETGEGAAVGYTITREDVGYFVCDSVVATNGADYLGRKYPSHIEVEEKNSIASLAMGPRLNA
ncbi:MAG: hypothetical protein Q9224_002084, partial [Gallowayella concinna]